MRTANRLTLALIGLGMMALSALALSIRTGHQAPAYRATGAWLPDSPHQPLLSAHVRQQLSHSHHWNSPATALIATVGALALLLALAQLRSRSPRALRLGTTRLRTQALAHTIQQRAEQAAGVDAVRVRILRGRTPRLHLTATLAPHQAAQSSARDLVPVVHETRTTTGLPLPADIHLT